MRSYGQFCAVARALDVIGDRWSLLLVRELLLGEARWTDLLDGVPGMAKNLLVERLRALEAAGILERVDGNYRLTERGRALAPVIDALAVWGVRELVRGAEGDAVRARWVRTAAAARAHGRGDTELLELTDDRAVLDVAGRRIDADPEGALVAFAELAVSSSGRQRDARPRPAARHPMS